VNGVLSAVESPNKTKNYVKSGPCQYCEFCTLCDECRHCPCETKGPNDLPYCEYCSYCPYCKYCGICQYCTEEGMLGKITTAITDITDSFWNKFGNAKDTVKDAIGQYQNMQNKEELLNEKKLNEVRNKYANKLKENKKDKSKNEL
jgi:hypothetical protein